MYRLPFLFVTITFILSTTAEPPCKGNNSDAVIQFVLVQDATFTYREFVSKLKKLMPTFLNRMTLEFPLTEFGLTAFVDYPNEFNSQTGYCYRLFQPFTTDHQLIINGLNNIKIRSGGNDAPESSLTGILFSATDRLIGWSNSGNRRGKKVYKVIAITTDESWKSKEDPGIEKKLPRPDPRGDGRDTCDNYPPSVKLVKSVLDKKGIYLLALIGGAIIDVWREYFSRYHFRQKRSKVVELDPNNAEKIAEILIDQFSEMITQEQCYKPKVQKADKIAYGQYEVQKGVGKITNFQGKNREDLEHLGIYVNKNL